ncbi:ANTAR domain-containing protein [Trebonia kvetii]|uniref:ANTAR domain-containing protein n=1 Tax=Trebonia kvetii TaxID=2480626 RepID=A0A6P2BPB8_9ACTN|nr:GAF and ANTAR domain-containing protein [Trebonia kvetii]TVZ00688.1 ANTAR domain-containing protein [Trebonia kvetii]
MSSEVQDDLAGLQNALLNTDSVEQFLHELAVLAARAVGDGMSCGLALRQRGRPTPVSACTDPLASEADRLQTQAGDGPALRALRDIRPQHVHDTATENRWPRFCRQAASLGVRSCYALPLVTGGEVAGALVLYGRRPGAFGPEEIRRAERFARNAAGALILALRLAACTDQNDQLRSSIVSRAVIDQALGVIMATQRCPQDKAFALLRGVSQNTNVKLRDLAASIVSNVTGEPPRPTAPFEDG